MRQRLRPGTPGRKQMKENAIVSLNKICKSFGGVPVLKNVGFELHEGEVHALVGGNGAGKSTLMKIMNGVYQKDSGVIRIRGQETEFQSIRDSWNYGIRMIFQELSLCPTLTVMENIFLTNELKKGALLDKRSMREKTAEILSEMKIDARPDDIIAELPVGTCQLIEIAKALFSNASILILDEPTASLTDREISILFRRIRELQKSGISFVYISHRMKEIFQIANRISVLRDGSMVMTKSISETSMEEVISEITSGRRGDMEYKPHEHSLEQADELFRAEHLSVGNIVKDISFSIKKGEVLGMAGLMGSGRTETAEAIFGIRNNKGAVFSLDGKTIEIRSVQDAIRHQIALVPEDRRREGLVLEHSVDQNVCLTNLDKIKSGILTNNRMARAFTRECISQYNIKASGPGARISSLSGGNQQKGVIAKWLMKKPRLLILDEPTAGVDIGAKGDIIDLVRAFVADGNGALFISSEMSELMAACDRIIVLCDGKIKSEYQRETITDEEILEHAIQQ